MAVDWLRHSCTYRAIFKKGFFKGFVEGYAEGVAMSIREDLGDVQIWCLRAWLRELGDEWLGLPSAEVRATIEAIADESELEKPVENLTNERLTITTWDDLFASAGFPSTARARLR